jgi:hypothetical protein
MKTNRLTHLMIITAASGLAALSTAGCTAKEKTAEASVPPAKEVATTTATAAVPGPSAAVQVATTASPDVASAKWSDIKDCSFDMRTQFSAGLQRLEAKVDDQIRELTAKRATMEGTADTKDWDFAMKEMGNARSYLKSMGEESSQATRETWDQQKEKVGQAWVRTQEAYGKVKASTTS